MKHDCNKNKTLLFKKKFMSTLRTHGGRGPVLADSSREDHSEVVGAGEDRSQESADGRNHFHLDV